jgi:hypothetical protein
MIFSSFYNIIMSGMPPDINKQVMQKAQEELVALKVLESKCNRIKIREKLD